MISPSSLLLALLLLSQIVLNVQMDTTSSTVTGCFPLKSRKKLSHLT